MASSPNASWKNHTRVRERAQVKLLKCTLEIGREAQVREAAAQFLRVRGIRKALVLEPIGWTFIAGAM